MANEIANVARVGIGVELAADPIEPILLGAWGVREASLVRVQGGTGAYLVELTEPGSAVVNAAGTGFVSVDQLVVFGDFAASGGRVISTLVPDPAAGALVPNARVNLTHLAFQVFDAAGTVADDVGITSVEVRQIPNG